MKPKYQRPRGTLDLLPDYLDKWQYVEGIWRSLARTFGYREIVTPMFEYTDLFVRGAGDTSDIVSKEMYTFTDRGGRSLSLRPEGTAPVVRAYLENKMYTWPQPVKLYYLAPMFRYERPQAGRFRQHTQYGVEVIGSPGPFTDAEVIKLLVDFYEKLGIQEIKLHLNSVGDKNCRPAYQQKLLVYLRSVRQYLCDDCQSRLERNPLRVLDCKQASCQTYLQNAPKLVDELCDGCQVHFDGLRKQLEALGINYVVNPRLVRGLDYYTRTAFEVVSDRLGAQDALAGGGRYDGLVELLGGKPTPAMGFGAGMERLIYGLEQHGIPFPETSHLEVFVISLGKESRNVAERLVWELRTQGIAADLDQLGSNKIRSQLSKGVESKAKYALIIGEDELARNVVLLRNLSTAQQRSVPMGDVTETIRNMLRGL